MAAVNAGRGLRRTAIIASVLWFVYWSIVYVLRPHAAENAPSSALTLSSPLGAALVVLLIVGAVIGAAWIVSGIRADRDVPRIDR